MSLDIPPGAALPTFEHLGVPPVKADDVDANQIGSKWAAAFGKAVSSQDVHGVLQLAVDSPWWRDLFALTWDMRTFYGKDKIAQFLSDRLPTSQLSKVMFLGAHFSQPWSDVAWITVMYRFETNSGIGNGVAYLVPTPAGWKALMVSTILDEIKGFPETTGHLRNPEPNHGKWAEQRRREVECLDGDPEVVVIGGGHSGLDMAARMKVIGTPTLIIEKNPRIGDQWRNRYEALCLHDPVWNSVMPYVPYPTNWPVYCPAPKMADWLECYAQLMELNIWNSSTVTGVSKSTKKSPKTGKLQWDVTVKRADGSTRILHVDHVVLALGLGAGSAAMPQVPHREEFKGQVLHAFEHKSARDHIGKKVVVVGACTSAHDIAADYAEHGVDVTMFQRNSTYVMSVKNGAEAWFKPLYWEGGPPTEVADLMMSSVPFKFVKLMAQRRTKEIAEADKAILEGLKKVGYQLNDGIDGAGHISLVLARGGGFYLDVGACQKIIDGEIKLKSGSEIERFTPDGLKFKDGTELKADVVIFATGVGDARGPLTKLIGEKLGAKMGPLWNMRKEGELHTVARELSLDPEMENLWYLIGNYVWSRQFSKYIALQIKAKQEGKFGERYLTTADVNGEAHAPN